MPRAVPGRLGLRHKRGCQWSLISHLCMSWLPTACCLLHCILMICSKKSRSTAEVGKQREQRRVGFNRQQECGKGGRGVWASSQTQFPLSLFHATAELPPPTPLPCACSLASVLMRRHGIIVSAAILLLLLLLFPPAVCVFLIIEFVQTRKRHKYAHKALAETERS